MHNHSQSGLTLIELLVTMLVSGILISAVYSVFSTHHKMAIKQEESTLMQQELLNAMIRITEELRMCGFSITGSQDFGFSHQSAIGAPGYGRGTNATAIYCTLDWNGDGIIKESGAGSAREHVGYRLNVSNNGAAKAVADNVLRKYDTGAVHWQPFSTNISDIRFNYLDNAGNLIPDASLALDSIRSVQVTITAVPSPHRVGLGIPSRTMTSTVLCRNIAK